MEDVPEAPDAFLSLGELALALLEKRGQRRKETPQELRAAQEYWAGVNARLQRGAVDVTETAPRKQ